MSYQIARAGSMLPLYLSTVLAGPILGAILQLNSSFPSSNIGYYHAVMLHDGTQQL